MEGKLQFDSHLGGRERLPAEINLKSFAAARAHEIEALTLALGNNDFSNHISFE